MQPDQPLDINFLLAMLGIPAADFYVIMAALAAFITVMLVGSVYITRNHLAARMKYLQNRRKALKEGITAPKRRRRNHEESVDFMRRVVLKLKLLQKNQSADLQSFLISAGIRSKDAIFVLLFFQFITPFLFFALSLLYLSISISDLSEAGLKLVIPLIAFYLGMKFPGYIVRRKRKKRYLYIQRALADTLDLLMICAEAGLSLAQGLERVSRELGNVYPEMADELSLTSIELSFQPDRAKTMLNLANRVQLPEIRGIVNVLIQTEKYGTPIAQALRTLSQEFRTQRMLRAEQKAARLPAIMTVPMILFILPTLFIVVVAPAAIQLIDTK
jgi:tight adherence protein C